MKIRYETTEISYEVVYEIIEQRGLGLYESPIESFSTGLIFKDEGDAETIANKMWLEKTTEDDRKGGWCALHFTVKERKLL